VTMQEAEPVLVVGIPAYNRAQVLPELLDSILTQELLPAQVVLCEDVSPERERIRAVCAEYRPRFAAASIVFTYHENERNCGFDKNLRNLFQHAVGDYLVIMGNDDRMAPGCLAEIATVAREMRPGFISRAYTKVKTDSCPRTPPMPAPSSIIAPSSAA
jgi:abequosyltransferase